MCSEPTDKMLGKLVVLLQYKWSEHEQIFWCVVEILKQRKTFCYHNMLSVYPLINLMHIAKAF